MNPGNDRRNARVAAASRHAPGSRGKHAGGTLLGVFIGVVLGLGIAAGVAFYLMRGGNPYQASAGNARDAGREGPAGRSGKADAAAGKPRFDFYKILPGGEDPKVQGKPAERSADKATVERTLTPGDDRSASKSGTAPTEGKSVERFWLQAGSFANESEAENLKARLALAGWEATVQEADVPDKGVRYRVRLGPYDNTDELNRMKAELGRHGFDVAVIKF